MPFGTLPAVLHWGSCYIKRMLYKGDTTVHAQDQYSVSEKVQPTHSPPKISPSTLTFWSKYQRCKISTLSRTRETCQRPHNLEQHINVSTTKCNISTLSQPTTTHQRGQKLERNRQRDRARCCAPLSSIPRNALRRSFKGHFPKTFRETWKILAKS